MPIGSQDPAQLLTSFREGEEPAFSTLFRQYYAPLCQFARRYLEDEQLCQDLVQETFLKLWERRESFVELSSVGPWLYTSVRNACLDRIRRSKVQGRRSAGFAAIQGEETWQDAETAELLRIETMRLVIEALQLLPAQMQKVMRMHYLDNTSLKDISTRLGISLDTVKYHKKQGLKSLRGRLGTLSVPLYIAAYML